MVNRVTYIVFQAISMIKHSSCCETSMASYDHVRLRYIQGLREVDNWGGGAIFIYSCRASLLSFEIDCFYAL